MRSATVCDVSTRMLSMWKGVETAYAVRNAVFGVQLAIAGMTAPEAPFSGRHGFTDQVSGPIELAPFGTGEEDFYLPKAKIKYWPVAHAMMAYDAATGREVWRFNTIPMPGEPGYDTWKSGVSADTGGGGTWTSYALDVKTGELFVPVANPAPDFNVAYRPGDNLFTNSLVVLDARTGKLKWWFQATPNDGYDYDLGAAPVLYTDARGKDVVALGSKDGYVYVVDRSTHKLRFKTPVTTINNSGAPTPEGVVACPGTLGGVEWNGPAFDPERRALYVGAVDWCSEFKSGEVKYVPGEAFSGGSKKQVGKANGWITAIDAETGKVRWKYEAGSPVVAGVTPTAGGVVFTGDMAGNFLALDSASGKVLYTMPTGGAIAGGVITYSVGDRQYVATTSGNISRTSQSFSPLSLGTPSIIILAVQ